MNTFFLVRHGHTPIDERQQLPDTALSEIGLIQAQQLIPRLEYMEIDYIYSSPYRRAIETASIVNAQLNVPICTEERLAEISLWLDPADLHDDTVQEHSDEMEAFQRTKRALHQFLNELNAEHSDKNIALFSHGNLIRSMLAYALKMDLETVVRINVGHASISILKWEDMGKSPFFRLDRFNDTCHLETLI